MSFRIKRLGHVAMTVPDVPRTVDFYERIFGMEVTERAGDAVYLRCNREHHALALFPGPHKALHHLGLELSNTTSLDQAAAHLRARGVEVTEVRAREPGHGPAIRFADADGNPIELYSGMDQIDRPLAPREVRARKFGHMNLLTRDLARAAKFYIDVLGFRLSDQMEERAAWLRCNQDHHGIAFLQSDFNAVHHYAYELDDWDALKRFADNLWRNNGCLTWGMARHGPGHNLFCYIGDDSGNIVELFAELDQIWDEENYVPGKWKDELRTLCVWGSVPPLEPFMRGEPQVF